MNLRKFSSRAKNEGFLFALSTTVLSKLGQERMFRTRLSSSGKWVYGRAESSDPWVMNQVFNDNEYDCVHLRSTNGLIIDGGANVGYTSVYLAEKYPTVTIVAVEPDPHNFRILERNVRQYPNVVPICAALWGLSGYISMSPTQFRDGNSWARTVSQEVGNVRAYTINELIDSYYSGLGEICVKIDVEGAETHIFQNHPKLWLGRCCQVVVELHPDSPFGDPTPLVDAIFCPETFIRTRSGELTVFRRLTL